MDQSGGTAEHQLYGTSHHSAGLGYIHPTSAQEGYSGLHGHPDDEALHQQKGKDQILVPLGQSTSDVHLDREAPDNHQGLAYLGGQQHHVVNWLSCKELDQSEW